MSLRSYHIERGGADRLLFLLHGWSSEQHHLAAYVPLIDPDERYTAICPRAPLDLPQGDGASWYDRVDSEPVAASFLEGLEVIELLVDETSQSYGIPLDRCVIGGFSQGGFLALAAALRIGAPRFAGVWAMCCGMPGVEGLELDLAPGSGGGRRALIQVGELDPIMPPERGQAVTTALRAAGWRVSEHGYQMGHSQRIEMMVDAKDWLAAL